MANVLTIADDDFYAEVLKASEPVLVYFSATWNPLCERQKPIVEKIAADYAGRVKVVNMDADINANTVFEYTIKSVPAIMVFKDGQQIFRQLTSMTYSHIEGFLKRLLDV